MRTSAVIPILLGAGALAQPHIKHAPLHHHHRRDQTRTWDEGNVHYVEDIVDVTVTLAPGQNALPATSSAPLAINEDWVKRPYNGDATNSPAPSHSAFFPAAEVVTYVTPQAPSATPTPVKAAAQEANYVPAQQHQQPSQPASQAQKPPPSPSSTPQQASSSSGGGSDTTYWSSSPKSPPTDPSGTDVLTRANYWRTKWISTLTDFTWSSMLANNSYETTITPTTYTTDPTTGQQVPHGEANATVMGHILYPGSFAQCIASGNNAAMNGTYSPFDQAFLMWICEEPNGLEDCTTMGEGGGSTDTGHAEIIKGGYTEIGCFWMGSDVDGGMWTCDFAGGPGT